jgi:hypothetical protein
MPLGPLDVGRPRDAAVVRDRPKCCNHSDVDATYVAPAFRNPGGRAGIEWRFVCRECVVGWFDGADWVAPVYHLSSINHL